jgi:hypothetical protein
MADAHHTTEFAQVLAAERERIARQRAYRGTGDGPLVGLSLSGGGIRSACFALGVLQGLAEREALPRVDYLSTVSGGGYAGAALTWFRRHGRAFPFKAMSPGTPLDFIRRHASYLDPSPRMTLLALAAVVLQQMLVSLFVYGSLLVGFFFLLDYVDRLLRPVKAIAGLYVESPTLDLLLPATNVASLVTFGLVALFVLSALWTTVATFLLRFRRDRSDVPRRNYVIRLRSQRRATRLLRSTLIAAVVASVPLLSLLWSIWIEEAWARGTLFGIMTAVAGLIGSVGLRSREERDDGGARPALQSMRMYVVMLVLLYGILLFSYTAALAIGRGGAVWTIAFVPIGILLGLLTAPNTHGSHRVYRDRLMETFMPNADAVTAGGWQPASEAAGFPLHRCSGETTVGPYHLLNASLTTTSSENARLRGRGADSFVLSPLYCGSAATGWASTGAWNRGTLSLATATAVSAAAADPHAAVGGHGATRGPLLSMLLAMLNLRLGFLAPNPNPGVRKPWLGLRPNLIVPGFFQNVLGLNLAETRPYIELADGGDFENLGIYELVRRRLDVIVAADGSQDGTLGFEALGNVVERVRADFGVTIGFEDPDRDLNGVIHGSGGLGTASRTYDFTRRAWAIGHVRYPAEGGLPEKDGLLLYVKATVFAGVPVDVLAYKAAHPEFPHESTFDQLFDERKFEAYRALGRAAVLSMLADDVAIGALALTRPSAPGRERAVAEFDPSPR